MKLKDRVALVTGGGSGIGRAIALLFAEEGARVVVNDLHLATAEKTVQEMGASARGAFAVAADVSDSRQVNAMFDEIERRCGALDALVNNAGIALGPGEDLEARRQRAEARIMEMVSGEGIQTHFDVTQEMSDEAWHRVIGVHLNGTFFCTRAALRLMSRQNRGAIVNLSSVAALMGLAQVPHYSAAKGGILALTRAVAREVGSRGIRVNAICPGYIDTPMTQSISPLARKALLSQTPLGRLAEPREVAATALFLACDDSSFYTGQWLSPNGGLFIG
ncbi:MAG TPA: SDR family NAD(P)-dependent oxidoreductase [Verrucomicrobiae bacterium]|jgi:3-oxoacyl-[acyl-carrier protein] reductase|nr:SDR family NAD(P)-dependent oxidoreductase [Verrucomicrobiae bacterium]